MREYCARRRDEIVAKLEEQRESEPGSQGGAKQIDAGTRSAAILELRNLKTKVENHRELRDEVLFLAQCDILEQPAALTPGCAGWSCETVRLGTELFVLLVSGKAC